MTEQELIDLEHFLNHVGIQAEHDPQRYVGFKVLKRLIMDLAGHEHLLCGPSVVMAVDPAADEKTMLDKGEDVSAR